MKDRLFLPLAIPIGAAVVIAAIIFLLSRILLAVPKAVAPPIALFIALGILLTAAFFASRPRITRGQVYAVLGIPGLVLLIAGIIGAIVGPYGEVHREEPLPPGGVVLTARNFLNVFDKTEITLPANQTVVVRFNNQDPGVAHNWSLYQGPGPTGPIFQGQLITGPATIDYTFPAPPPGTYFYQCDVHPTTMTGTAHVR